MPSDSAVAVLLPIISASLDTIIIRSSFSVASLTTSSRGCFPTSSRQPVEPNVTSLSPLIRGGRSLTLIAFPSHMIIALQTAFSSSRTLPGQVCRVKS